MFKKREAEGIVAFAETTEEVFCLGICIYFGLLNIFRMTYKNIQEGGLNRSK